MYYSNLLDHLRNQSIHFISMHPYITLHRRLRRGGVGRQEGSRQLSQLGILQQHSAERRVRRIRQQLGSGPDGEGEGEGEAVQGEHQRERLEIPLLLCGYVLIKLLLYLYLCFYKYLCVSYFSVLFDENVLQAYSCRTSLGAWCRSS
jgi:hypothetical protein